LNFTHTKNIHHKHYGALFQESALSLGHANSVSRLRYIVFVAMLLRRKKIFLSICKAPGFITD